MVRTSLTVVALAAPLVSAANVFQFVNEFIGTASGANGGSGGNAFPGAAIPHGMAKVGIDVDTAPRQAGYIHDNSSVTGISLMHDEGTGGNTDGGYGLFPLFPLASCTFTSCPVAIEARKALRAANSDTASPGYFSTTFTNRIKLETTATRRAGLIRFTFPTGATSRNVVVDLAHDLQRSFQGGNLTLNATTGRVMLDGIYLQSYGPSNYTAHGCYDFRAPTGVSKQAITTAGTFRSTVAAPSNITITPAKTSATISFPYTGSTLGIEAGALLSFSNASNSVLARFGVSMISAAQACANAEEEVPDWKWTTVQTAAENQWSDILGAISVNTTREDPTVLELLYSSLYRTSLVPANYTGENPYWGNEHPFSEAYCSWDVFRTSHPLQSLLYPTRWANIVDAYIDSWRHTGYIMECRSNTKPGYVQGGSDGMPILGDFAVKYGARAASLGIDTDDLYEALVHTAEDTPPNWYTVGRQNTAWKQFGYIPTDWTDPTGSTGLPTREASRALEYALGDFAVRQAAIALNKSAADIDKYANRSMNFINHWNANLTFDGFSGFMQRRYPNGTFAYSPPDACSPVDSGSHSCARGTDNDIGFYESSSWEYSFFAPQSMSTLVELMGGNETFVNRTNFYFSEGYFYAGNEPSFEVPFAYHYANRPDLSVQRVRQVVYSDFSTGIGGIPGNDDSGAMASLLVFHLLGLYPVPASRQLLLGSPFLSAYTLSNDLLGTRTTVTVAGFDPATLAAAPPVGSRLFVQNVTVRGAPAPSVCWLDFADLTGGGDIVITVGATPRADGCGPGGLPDSLATGGFAA